MNLSISKIIEANEICKRLALVPHRFNKNRARYDFSKFVYQMKITQFSSKSTPKNIILVLIYEGSAPEFEIKVVEDFDTEFQNSAPLSFEFPARRYDPFSGQNARFSTKIQLDLLGKMILLRAFLTKYVLGFQTKVVDNNERDFLVKNHQKILDELRDMPSGVPKTH